MVYKVFFFFFPFPPLLFPSKEWNQTIKFKKTIVVEIRKILLMHAKIKQATVDGEATKTILITSLKDTMKTLHHR